MQAWQVLSTEYVIENRPYNSTRKERCRLPNDIEIDFYVHKYPDWVNAVVLTPDMDMVLVEQYRHGVMHCMTEIPAGMVEDGENPAEAIVREVAEETGYSSEKSPILLGEFFPNPGIAGNRLTTYLIPEARPLEKQSLDSTEAIQIQLVPLESFGQMIIRGQASQAFSALAYFLAKDFLKA